MNYYRNVIIVDKHYDWDLLSDDWYISVKYDGKVSVIEVTKETYMSYQIGDSVFMDILTGVRVLKVINVHLKTTLCLKHKYYVLKIYD